MAVLCGPTVRFEASKEGRGHYICGADGLINVDGVSKVFSRERLVENCWFRLRGIGRPREGKASVPEKEGLARVASSRQLERVY